MRRLWLANLLREQSITHKKVAALSQIDRAYFTQIVNGERRPSPEVAKRIADILGFGDEWYRLLEDVEHKA